MNAIVGWTGLRCAWGLLVVGAAFDARRRPAAALSLAWHAMRASAALVLMGAGATLARDGPRGDMDGDAQMYSALALLAFSLALLPEVSAVRLRRYGEGGRLRLCIASSAASADARAHQYDLPRRAWG